MYGTLLNGGGGGVSETNYVLVCKEEVMIENGKLTRVDTSGRVKNVSGQNET